MASELELEQHSFAYSQTIVVVVIVAVTADDDVIYKGLRYCWCRIRGIHGGLWNA